jgi:hypothetical protein
MELNENETTVLKSLIKEMDDCTGGEFGYLPDADRCEFNKHQFAGYISILKQKDCFEYLDTDSGENYEGQFAIKQQIYNEYKKNG